MNNDALSDSGTLSASEASRVLRNTYLLLSMTVIFSAVTAVAGLDHVLAPGELLMSCIVSLGLLFLTWLMRNSVLGLVAIFAFTGWEGYWIGPVISHYLSYPNGPHLVATAAGLTGFVFLSLSGYALITRKSFEFLGGFLFSGLLVLVGIGVLNLFIDMPALSLALSAAGVMVFCGYVLYDTSRIIHGGQSNYIMATVELYLDILNLFLDLLRLLSIFMDDD